MVGKIYPFDNADQRTAYLDEIGAFFANLPPDLSDAATRLLASAEIASPTSGAWQNILGEPEDFPALSLPVWLLDHAEFPRDKDREAIERHLFLCGFYVASRLLLFHLPVLDGNSESQKRELLGLLLQARAARHLSALAKDTPDLNDLWERVWEQFAKAETTCIAAHVSAGRWFTSEEIRRAGHRLAPLKFGLLAAACVSNRSEWILLLDEMADELCAVYQIWRDIRFLSSDLSAKKLSLPIAVLLRASGSAPGSMIEPNRILSALLLTQAIPELLDECLGRVSSCRRLGQAHGMEDLNPFLADLEERLKDTRELYVLTKSDTGQRPRVTGDPAPSASDPASGVVVNDRPAVDRVSKTALASFLESRSWDEAHEVHRWGFLGEPLLTGRLFTEGLIALFLSRAGVDVGERAASIIDDYKKGDYAYFDEPCALPQDIDTLGLMMQLYKVGFPDRPVRDFFDRPLSWVRQHRDPTTGDVPVWIGPPDRLSTVIVGAGCVTCKTHLLLGLLDWGGAHAHDVLWPLADFVFRKVLSSGLQSSAFYTAAYSLWSLSRLIRRLENEKLPPELEQLVAPCQDALLQKLDLIGGEVRLSAQTAALLLMSAHGLSSPGQIRQRWLDTIVATQRIDGTWPDEPLYLVPGRNHTTTWHSSRLLTSAICLLALRQWADNQSNDSMIRSKGRETC